MDVSRVSFEFSSKDVMSIIKDFIKVPGLNIDKLDIEDRIIVGGTYYKGVSIPFSAAFTLAGVKDNIITLNLTHIKIGKLGVFKWISNIATTRLAKELSRFGITAEKDKISIKLKEVLSILPFHLELDLMEIRLQHQNIIADVGNICFSMNRNYKKNNMKENNEVIYSKILENKSLRVKTKLDDSYTKVRYIIEDKVPDKYDKYLEYAFILPDVAALLYRLFRDKRVPIKTKIIVGFVIGYLTSPLDILPDFIPLIGKIDDLALCFFALNKIINEIPIYIIEENWQGEKDIILVVKEGIKYINKLAGGYNVAKLFAYIINIWKKSTDY